MDARLTESIQATYPSCLSLLVCLADPGSLVALGDLLPKAGRLCLSPLVVGSNALAETTAMSGQIVAVCGVLSRADFNCQEGAVGLDIAVELARPIGPGWQKLWANRERTFCQHHCPQMPH
jgi:hypothetical protein